MKKTKLMIIIRQDIDQNQVTGCLKALEIVSDYVYVGSLISCIGKCDKEIRLRIILGRNAMAKLIKIWQNRATSETTQRHLVEVLVFSVFLYGCETRTVKGSDKSRIGAFEMWCWQKMLRVPWTQKRTNALIIEELHITRRLSSRVRQKCLQFLGHVLRRKGDNLEKTILQGKIQGRRSWGRAASRCFDQAKITSLLLHILLRKAEDRCGWRHLTEVSTI